MREPRGHLCVTLLLFLTALLPKALGVAKQPGGVAAELHEVHRLPAAAALPLHHHLLPAGHAAVRGKVQLRRDGHQEEHLRQLPPGPAHRVPGGCRAGLRWGSKVTLPKESEEYTKCLFLRSLFI